jgi:hypothetical protein
MLTKPMSSSRTPQQPRRTRSSATTPGDYSVTSARSVRSARSTQSDASEGGVPWNIKAQLAQDIEDQYPLSEGGINVLLNLPGQPLSNFLDSRNEFHGEELYGAGRITDRDPLRKKIGDLVQRWRQKDYQAYDKDVLTKYQVHRRATAKKPSRKVDQGDSDASSLSSAEYIPEKPSSKASKRPTRAAQNKKTPKKPTSSKKSLVGKTVTTTSPKNLPSSDTDPLASLSDSFSTFSIGSEKKKNMSSLNTRKYRPLPPHRSHHGIIPHM